MNENVDSYQPSYIAELEQLHLGYDAQLIKLFDGPVDCRMISLQNGPKATESNRAILIAGKNSPERDADFCLFSDHDDTMEPYTERKLGYVGGLLDAESAEQPGAVAKVLHILNKAARVRPFTRVGPERYSPLVEMVADTALFGYLRERRFDAISALLTDPSEDNARQFIHDLIIPLFTGKVDTFTEGGKQYFREAKHQALAVNWNEKPVLVSENVWGQFVAHMTKPTIPDGEIAGLNLDPKIKWIVSTFGEVGFQTQKVVNALLLIKQKTNRVPDEVLLFTRGRKEPIVSSIISGFPPEMLVYALDDSLGQLEKYAVNPRIIPLRAIRAGSKRANGVAPDGMRIINMEEGDLNGQLLAIYSQDRNAWPLQSGT